MGRRRWYNSRKQTNPETLPDAWCLFLTKTHNISIAVFVVVLRQEDELLISVPDSHDTTLMREPRKLSQDKERRRESSSRQLHW